MRRRQKNRKQVRMVVGLSICLLLMMSVGYAAFSTNLTLNAKGNILTTPEECFTVTDNGDGTGTITNYDISCGKKVKIPSKINNLTITKIGDGTLINGVSDGPFTHKKITTVVFPETLTYIGYISFFDSVLKRITIPSSVREIKSQAFAFSPIETVELNEGLEKLGSEVFTRCNLTSIALPKSLENPENAIATANLMEGDNAFIYGKDSEGFIDKSYLNSYGNRNATSIEFPNNIKTIGTLSIYLMPGITILNIPDNVETLKNHFIYNMQNLKTINIGSGIKTIEENAFIGGNLKKLKTININRKKDAIQGAPWGASEDVTINWTG